MHQPTVQRDRLDPRTARRAAGHTPLPGPGEQVSPVGTVTGTERGKGVKCAHVVMET